MVLPPADGVVLVGFVPMAIKVFSLDMASRVSFGAGQDGHDNRMQL